MSAATSPELHDRRQRAREAGLDAVAGLVSRSLTTGVALDEAIETATRVRIDEDIVNAVKTVTIARGSEQIINILRVAFEAAGFEVEN
jgi:hypothetical protein